MSIKIELQTDGKDLMDSYEEDEPTLNECALIVFRLEEIKKYLLSKDFENKFEVRKGSFVEDA